MYEEERQQKMCRYVKNHSRASVRKLCGLFDVSESTVRRDLTELEKRKLLKRTHGGAICMESVGMEQTYNEKKDFFRWEKECIAAKAASLIEDGDSILIDSGTTTLYIVPYLSAFKKLSVVTNSILLMQQLANLPNVTLISVGGTLRSNTMAVVGPVTEENLARIRVDKAFMGTNGFSTDTGLTTPNVMEASTKHKMMQVAKQVYVLADHSKIGRVSFVKFGSLADIDGCITSTLISQDQKRELTEKGIRLFTVDMSQNSRNASQPILKLSGGNRNG